MSLLAIILTFIGVLGFTVALSYAVPTMFAIPDQAGVIVLLVSVTAMALIVPFTSGILRTLPAILYPAIKIGVAFFIFAIPVAFTTDLLILYVVDLTIFLFVAIIITRGTGTALTKAPKTS